VDGKNREPRRNHRAGRGRATFLRRLDLTLRTPDALNIAIAQRAASVLMTFDEKMAANAHALGTPLVAA
jgi:predicted nucleic acid-binding protein